ncbi:Protein of unknown function [Duganella sp. CF402]|uniref:DUF3052 family protein n=1 Tax=unclassified Duganella TaxID=2636909 RepID=UPI0008AF011C|nr:MULTISPECIES: DUF3052 family protein [unclassified Duganella]RZT09061.1 DUF3052 family protein [Duganella sp. BK701]SEL71880.1 Protein of unknown function [Duganella sp. CF402]
MAVTFGYSGTPLAKKLGIVADCKVWVRNAPEQYQDWLAPLPEGVQFQSRLSATTDVVHLFCDRKADLTKQLAAARAALKPDGTVWVSWPKKASKVPTDITEDTIRELCLPFGFVDVKVCAVSEVWSGLKLVIRKELR